MVLENVKEMWTEAPRTAGGKKGRPVNKDRFISKMWVLPPSCVVVLGALLLFLGFALVGGSIAVTFGPCFRQTGLGWRRASLGDLARAQLSAIPQTRRPISLRCGSPLETTDTNVYQVPPG